MKKGVAVNSLNDKINRCVICAERDSTYSGMESNGCDKINMLKAAETLSPGYVP